MPRCIPLLEQSPRPAGQAKVRIVSFLLPIEDIYLSYNHGSENGPGIERTGRGSPCMQYLAAARIPGETTTDPDGLRLRTWLIHDGLWLEDLRRVWERLWPWVGAKNEPEPASFIQPWLQSLGTKLANRQPLGVGAGVPYRWAELIKAEQDRRLADVAESLTQLHALAADPALGAPPDLVKVLGLWRRLNQAENDRNGADMRETLWNLLNAAATLTSDPAELKTIELLRAYLVDHGDASLREPGNTLPRSDRGLLPAHDTNFVHSYAATGTGPAKEVVGQQGCGDLTMNLWNVAFVNSELLARRNEPKLIFLHKEPLDTRTYDCLVKWKPGSGHAPRVEIREMRFWANATTVNEMASVFQGGEWIHSGDRIEFAVSNQQVIRDGKVADLGRITHQFGDFRHLLKMPNLNPKKSLEVKVQTKDTQTTAQQIDTGRPRFYFGRTTHDDIWLGEAQFMDDVNLQRAAMQGPVFLSRLYQGLGASMDQVRGAMYGAGYTPPEDGRRELKRGEYRFASEDDALVEVFLKPNCYGWTMIGLNKACDEILCLASQGNPAADTGYSLAEAAEALRAAGAHNALLMDEGADVFQRVLLSEAKGLEDTVPLLRTRLRATFIFARERGSAASGTATPAETRPAQA